VSGPSDRARRSVEGIGQRLLVLCVFGVFGVLIWLAHSGRYDTQIDLIAAWLHRHFEAIGRLLH